jgi:hypothetical protein
LAVVRVGELRARDSQVDYGSVHVLGEIIGYNSRMNSYRFPAWVTGFADEADQDVADFFDPQKSHQQAIPAKLRTGQSVYEWIKVNNLLPRCLAVTDLEQIKALDAEEYRKKFGGAVFGWKSVVKDAKSFLYVPYLFEFGDGIYIHWFFLEFGWKELAVWLID